MNNLTDLLREADPVRHEPGLSSDARDAMRRAVLAAADAGVPAVPRWRQPMALAAMTVLAVFGAAVAHRFADTRREPVALAGGGSAAPGSVARQLQFRTPGGTRIIWTIDPSFHLGGPLP